MNKLWPRLSLWLFSLVYSKTQRDRARIRNRYRPREKKINNVILIWILFIYLKLINWYLLFLFVAIIIFFAFKLFPFRLHHNSFILFVPFMSYSHTRCHSLRLPIWISGWALKKHTTTWCECCCSFQFPDGFILNGINNFLI